MSQNHGSASPPKGGGRDRQVAEGALVGRKGFTLVEILVVIAIVGLLAAMAIPNLLRGRLNTNEAAVQAALRGVSSAMTAYRTVNPTYPSNLQQLGSTAGTLSYLDDALAQGRKYGYNFIVESSDAYRYLVRATPQTSGVTGNRTFTLTQLGEIQLASAAVASTNSVPTLPTASPSTRSLPTITKAQRKQILLQRNVRYNPFRK